MGALKFRNKQGELVDIQSVSATLLKNKSGTIVEEAVRGGAVAITRHEVPRAILISVEEFTSLMDERSNRLDALSGEFDGLLAKMQKAGVKKGLAAAFNASPQTLGRAAVKAARK